MTPSQPAGVGSLTRPTFAPANWSFSSALIMNSVFAGVMPSAASRWKNVLKALSYCVQRRHLAGVARTERVAGRGAAAWRRTFLSCVSEM